MCGPKSKQPVALHFLPPAGRVDSGGPDPDRGAAAQQRSEVRPPSASLALTFVQPARRLGSSTADGQLIAV